ncbi:MAG: matrixin family metalloprotease [Phycisphaerales bacterium]
MSNRLNVRAPGVHRASLGVIAGLALAAGSAHAADWLTTRTVPTRPVLFGQHAEITPLDAAKRRAEALMEMQTFLALPLSAKQAVIDAGAAPTAYEPNEFDERVLAEHGETPYEAVAAVASRETYEKMRPIHRHMLKTLLETVAERGPIVSLCFTPDTPSDIVQAFDDAILLHADRFNLTGRWSTSALGEPSYAQGEPVRLTYSFVPDGTFVPNLIGASGNSQLFAFLDGIYGDTATWQAIYADMWDRWASISGLEFVLEPNDDGVALNDNPGVVGVRGDLRMAAIPIDGGGGTLAYNNFPNDGDMVLDAFDSFYSNTSNNSLRLFNILAHEHGHGQGLLHVCPREENKLMEPFISTAFNGPQFDDILASQRHYGDNFEPNDNAGEASDLGAFSGSTLTENLLSIDDDSDVDYFSFTTTSAGAVAVTVRAANRAPYLSGPQNSGCTGGSLFDPRIVHDLKVDILAADGVTVLDSVDATGAGEDETAVAALPAPGTYFARVRGSGANNIQRYAIDIETAPSLVRLASAFDEVILPGTALDVAADAFSNPGDAIVAGSVTLNYRLDGGAFTQVVMTADGPNRFIATLPSVSCGDTPEFYFSAQTSGGGTLQDPVDGAGDPYSFIVGELTVAVDDDFETNTGWTVSGNASDGQWTRGVPVNDDRGDPASDFDGSGQCWLTDNTPGNSDVDGGSTILTSVVYDASEGGTLTYAYWVNSGPGVLDGDTLAVQAATDAGGTNWATVRTYSTESDNWRTDSLAIAVGGDIEPTSTLRLRFIATDGGAASLIEAGIDALRIEAFSCVDVIVCEGDTNGDNLINFTDLNTVLANFGDSGAGVPGDVNGDELVNFTDLNIVLANFGETCN